MTHRMPAAGTVIDAVASYYRVDAALIRGQRRMKNIALARQIAMYLIRRLTNLSLPQIGASFEDRDHTTVLHAVRRIDALMESDPLTKSRLLELERVLTSLPEPAKVA